MRKQEISFVFVGSHDECDHWLRNNAGFEALADNGTAEVLELKNKTDDENPPCRMQEDECGMEADDYDAGLLHDLTDSDLRKIFAGLCVKRT
jgi:hypothetical protein